MDQQRPSTTNCIMQQKKGMMFVSEYFLIFISYIFQLNWNLSGHIGREWHHSSSCAVSPWLMRCNKKRERERWKEIKEEGNCRLNELQFRVNGNQKRITASGMSKRLKAGLLETNSPSSSNSSIVSWGSMHLIFFHFYIFVYPVSSASQPWSPGDAPTERNPCLAAFLSHGE